MEPLAGRFSAVIVGRWNPSIFNPDWIRANLCANSESTVALAFAPDNPDAPFRLSFEDLHLFPSQSRLEIHPVSLSSEGIAQAASVARNSLSLLKHTPVSAVGINFAFVDTNASRRISGAVSFNDSQYIDSDRYSLLSAEIARKFRVDETWNLNFRLFIDGASRVADFNYHAASHNADHLTEILSDTSVRSNYTNTIDFLRTVYDIDITGNAEQ